MPTKLFVAWENPDALLGTDLVKFLRIIAAPNAWQIETEADLDPREIARSRRQKFREIDAIVFVAGIETLASTAPGNLIGQILETLESRPETYLATVLTGHAPLLPELKTRPVFPEISRPIDPGPLRDRDLKLAAEAIFEQLLASPKTTRHLSDEATPNEDFLIKKLPELQIRIADLLEKQQPGRAVSLLQSVVADADERERLATFENDWEKIHHAFNRLHEKNTKTVEVELQDLTRRIRQFSDELTDEKLAPSWQSIFGKAWLGIEQWKHLGLPFLGLLATSAEIQIPDSGRTRTTRRVPGFAQNAEHQPLGNEENLWGHGQKLEFKREMRLIQDALAVENFDRAFEHADHIRHHLDPESAQLYEFLLLAYLKKETPEKIVLDAIGGRGDMLRHVWLFAGRLLEYQDAGKCPTETGAHNIRAVATELADTLAMFYAGLEPDTVLGWATTDKMPTALQSSPSPEYDSAAHFHARKCLDIATDLNRFMARSPGFLDLAVHELAGGGKFRWVDGVGVRNGEFHIFSRTGTDVETKMRELLNLLADFDHESRKDAKAQSVQNQVFASSRLGVTNISQQKLLAENLLGALEYKFREIHRRWPDWQKRLQRPEEFLRQALVRVVNASVLGFEIFGDEQFLALPKQILFEQAELAWFDFDDAGGLIEHPDCVALAFPSKEVLEKILQILGKDEPATTASGLERVATATLARYKTETAAIFQNLREVVERHPPVFELKNRQRLVECLRRWRILYKLEGDAADLDNVARELSGAGIFQWLDFDPLQICPVAVARDIGFDPVAVLFELKNLPTTLSEDELNAHVAWRIFQKIKTDYAEIRPGDEAARPLLAKLLLKTQSCWRHHHEAQYLEFLAGELSGETKLAWLDLNEKAEAVNRSPLFDARATLLELGKLDARFSLLDMRERLALRRYQDALAEFHREVSEFPEHNHRHERAVAVQFIRRSKIAYQYFPRAEFLDEAMRELRGQGRIRWQDSLLRWLNPGRVFAFDNVAENARFNFNYKLEMKLIQQLWGESGERMRGVLEATGNGEF